MKKKIRLSKRTTALLVAAVLLLAGGTVTGTRAALNIRSELYRAHFYLNHLQVHLIENGKDVCGGSNDLNGQTKVTGNLATSLGYDGKKLGEVEPGKFYKEEIAAENGQDIDEFVRLTVRKYWVKTDKDGNIVKENGKEVKAENMDPSWIHLRFGGKDGYNTSAWFENPAERTDESSTYYYKSDLDGGAVSKNLFDEIMIDRKIAEKSREIETVEGNKKIYTYVYKYDGAIFFIEADVQAIQTHNANDAIRSQWGVRNITAAYDDPESNGTGSGSLSLN